MLLDKNKKMGVNKQLMPVLNKLIKGFLKNSTENIITSYSIPTVFSFMQLFNRLNSLYDFTAVDYPHFRNRFLLIYNLLFFSTDPFRILLTRKCDQFSTIPTLSNHSHSAIWLEREVYDLFGIFFENHPDLRRILTDYGFEGHPLRKDFPVTGFLEISYNLSRKVILFAPLELQQELRLPASFQPSWT